MFMAILEYIGLFFIVMNIYDYINVNDIVKL